MLLSGRYELLGPELPLGLAQGPAFPGRCVASGAPVLLVYPRVSAADDAALARCVALRPRAPGASIRALGWARDPRGDRPVIALEAFAGETLRAVLRRGPLGLDDARWAVLEAAKLFEAAHAEGRCLGPVSPDDLVVQAAAGGWALRLLPSLELGGPEANELPAGAPVPVGALAPELLSDARARTPAIDVFCLGVLFYELLSGRLPIEGKTVREQLMKAMQGRGTPIAEHRRDLPGPVALAIQRALRPDPAERPASVAAFRRAIEG